MLFIRRQAQGQEDTESERAGGRLVGGGTEGATRSGNDDLLAPRQKLYMRDLL